MTATRHLALFDFDGTLTRRDTMFAFVLHARGPLRLGLGLGLLLPWLVGHRLGLIPAEKAKIRFLRQFFAGEPRARLAEWGAGFADRVELLLRPAARARLDWHREQGHEIWVVSASLDLWVRPWAERRGLGVLCTEARFEEDRFLGQLGTPNCNGPEKERRIRDAVRIEDYAHIYAYGDSAGDAEMLALATESWMRPFRGPDGSGS